MQRPLLCPVSASFAAHLSGDPDALDDERCSGGTQEQPDREQDICRRVAHSWGTRSHMIASSSRSTEVRQGPGGFYTSQVRSAWSVAT